MQVGASSRTCGQCERRLPQWPLICLLAAFVTKTSKNQNHKIKRKRLVNKKLVKTVTIEMIYIPKGWRHNLNTTTNNRTYPKISKSTIYTASNIIFNHQPVENLPKVPWSWKSCSMRAWPWPGRRLGPPWGAGSWSRTWAQKKKERLEAISKKETTMDVT